MSWTSRELDSVKHIRVVPELEILTILPDRTSKSIIVNVQPHPVQRPFWQASLFHLPPKFTSTVKKYGNGNGVRELYLNVNKHPNFRKILAVWCAENRVPRTVRSPIVLFSNKKSCVKFIFEC